MDRLDAVRRLEPYFDLCKRDRLPRLPNMDGGSQLRYHISKRHSFGSCNPPNLQCLSPFVHGPVESGSLNSWTRQYRLLVRRMKERLAHFEGKTFSLVYCDEMTLYPDSIIDMIDTRLSNPHSMGFASMNPSSPTHKIKQWIDKAEKGDPNYYSLHFILYDSPYVDEPYKQRIRDSLSGLFYKRNYLGLWCLAEGARIILIFSTDQFMLSQIPLSLC